jgi:hypothetical protein
MAKKDKTPKLPKKLGGVKLPKELRKTAKSALKLAQNPVAREVMAAALVAGASALAKRKTEKPAPEPTAKGSEIGNLIAQGVAAFVSGLGKPPERKTSEPGSAEPKPAEPKTAGPAKTAAPRPAARPRRRPSA